MSKQDEVIVIGKFGASYGIRGWLKVVSFTDQPESIFDYKPWLIQVKGEWVEFSVESWKRHKGLVCKLEGLEVREEAHCRQIPYSSGAFAAKSSQCCDPFMKGIGPP